MRIIKLHTIDSTNDYLKQLAAQEELENFTTVTANFQTNGKGQRGSVWESESGDNLMFSVFLDTSFLAVNQHFYLNTITSLAITKVLKTQVIRHVKIKWPNDILSDNLKICGILIENNFKGTVIKHAVIGVGINVNQLSFDNLPSATSLKKLTGAHYNLDELLYEILLALKFYYQKLQAGQLEELKTLYKSDLFRKNKPSTFKNIEGELFVGYIKDVTEEGKIQILLEDEVIGEYDLKEVSLIY